MKNRMKPTWYRIRKPLLSVLLMALGVLVASKAESQVFLYGNGWYRPNADYVRMKVAHDGIYRVSPQQLAGAGLDTVGLNLENIHLIYRGQEQYIHVDTVGGQWNFIEFLGHRNDGRLDTMMFADAYSGAPDGSAAPYPARGIFSDTSVYYLHVDNLPGLRYTLSSLSGPAPGNPTLQRNAVSVREFEPGVDATFETRGDAIYDIFHDLNPDWTSGEGYLGPSFGPGSDLIVHIPTPHPTGSAMPHLMLRLVSHQSWLNEYQISLAGNLLVTDTLNGESMWDYDIECPFSLLGDTQTLRIHVTNLNASSSMRHFLAYTAIDYVSANIMDGHPQSIFLKSNPSNDYMKFRNLGPATSAVAIDEVNHIRYLATMNVDTLGIWIAGSPLLRPIYLSTDSGMATPVVEPGLNSSLSLVINGADMVLITDRRLSSSALAYQSYRQNSTVNPLNVRVVYTDEIYNEFGYGSPHPLAIKRFCKFAIDQWAIPPSHFLIWGRGHANIRAGGDNFVPAYSVPPADAMYLTGFHRDSSAMPSYFVPEAAIGRLPIVNDQQGLDYIAKLQSYEETPAADWMRNAAIIGSGNDTIVTVAIDSYLDSLGAYATSAPTHSRLWNYLWTDSTLESNASLTAETVIDSLGTGMVVTFGVDFMVNEAMPPSVWSNPGKYPLFMGTGFEWGNFGGDTATFVEQLLLDPEVGCALALTHSSYAYLVPLGNWTNVVSRNLFRDQAPATVGEALITAASEYVSQWIDRVYINHVRCMNLLGDPSAHYRRGELSVWPGDTDDDLVVNNADLLNIGVAYGDTGAVRMGATLNWQAQSATAWDSAFTSGINHVHADCNGDGIVSDADTLAIAQNYGLTHNKWAEFLGLSGAGPLLSVEASDDTVAAGDSLTLFVMLGTSLSPADTVYGLAWSLHFDPALVDTSSITVDFANSWVNGSGDHLLSMSRISASEGVMDLAFTRTDQQSVSGWGEVARIGIVVIDNISGKRLGDTSYTPLDIFPAAAKLVDARGVELPLQGTQAQLQIRAEGLPPALEPGLDFGCYPNPTSGQVYLQTRSDGPCKVQVFDLSGRQVSQVEFPAGASRQVDLDHLAPGSYILEASNADGVWRKHLQKVD